MASSTSFHQFLRGLEERDANIIRPVLERYTQRLCALARAHLHAVLRTKVDADDVVQSAFKSFFAGQAEGQYELNDWDSLWGLLAQITLRKCGRKWEHFTAGRRDVRRESRGFAAGDSAMSWTPADDEPSPEEAAMLAETVESLLRGLPERDREIIALRLQGYSIAEISGNIGRTERTIHRKLACVRQALEDQVEE